MRFFALFAVFGLVLAAALAVPAATADSSDAVVAAVRAQSPAPIAHKAAPEASPSVNSVRMKVSPVTYAGPLGRRMGETPSSAPGGRLESSLPAKGHAAPRAVAVRTAPRGGAATPVAVLTRLPGTNKGPLVARTCAKRLMALVERGVMSDLASRAVAV